MRRHFFKKTKTIYKAAYDLIKAKEKNQKTYELLDINALRVEMGPKAPRGALNSKRLRQRRRDGGGGARSNSTSARPHLKRLQGRGRARDG